MRSSPGDYEGVCFDCPARRRCVLESIVRGGKGHCRFTSLALEARAMLPASVCDRHGIALIRRGALIRERTSRSGDAVAIDFAGPGSLALVEPTTEGARAYAVTDTLVCVLREQALPALVEAGGSVAKDFLSLHREAALRAERFAQARGARTAEGKVTAVLELLAAAFSDGPRSGVPDWVQQRDIAALSGTRHETTCRILKARARARDGRS